MVWVLPSAKMRPWPAVLILRLPPAASSFWLGAAPGPMPTQPLVPTLKALVAKPLV